MEKIAYFVTNYLIERDIIDAKMASVYQYGLQIGMEVCLNTGISIFIAVFYHMEWETITFFIVFILLRLYAGGVHLNTYISCLLCSIISLWGLLMIVKYLRINSLLSLGIMFISLIFVKLLSPVQDINRPLSLEEMEIFKRNLNYSILGIVILSVLFYLFHLEKLLMMVSVTTFFMVGILVLGKIKNKKHSGI